MNPLLKGDRYSLPALPDSDAHIMDPEEYLEAKRKRAAKWLKETDPDKYMEQFRDPGDEQPKKPHT